MESDRPKALYLLKRFLSVNLNAARVYLPVHLIVLLIRLKNNKQDRKSTVLKFFKEMAGSCLFASGFAMSIPASYACLNDILPHPKSSNIGMLISFTFSWAIFFDSKSRWSEMSLYVLAQWFEGYTYSLYKRKLVPVIPQWEKLVFGISMAIISYSYFSRSQEEEKQKDSKMDMVLKFILGSHNLKA